MKGYCDRVMVEHAGIHEALPNCTNFRRPIPLRQFGSTQITESTVGYKDDELEAARKRVLELEQALRGKTLEFTRLQEIYNKLADQWNAFQATAKPEQKFVYRAEASGHVARRLAEVFLSLAYDTGGLDDLIKILTEIANKYHAGQTVEVTEKLMPHRG